MGSWINKIWTEWNIRGAVLFSLLLQIILILLSPLRKRTSNKFLIFIIWSAYLVADIVATFAIGLISKTHIEDNSNKELISFWAPFLLMHLGGPDTITAFAMEDNQLWIRHFLTLAFQTISTLYFLLISFSTNKFKIPTLLVFIAGVIKYWERTCSMYLASKDKFRGDMIRDPDPGNDYDSEYETTTTTTTTEQPLIEEAAAATMPIEFEMVKMGYANFNSAVKPLLADLILEDSVWDVSEFESARDALRVLEIELNFAYEVLFTKVAVVHSTWGRFGHGFAFLAVLLAFLIFHFHDVRSPGGDVIDIDVTYALLYGALALDVVAFVMSILSDWVVVLGTSRNVMARWFRDRVHVKLLRKSDVMYRVREEDANDESDKQTELARPILFRRWNRSVSGFNLMDFSIRKEDSGTLNSIESFVNEWRFKSRKPLTLELWEFIYLELGSKSRLQCRNDAERVRKTCYGRGEVILEINQKYLCGIDLMAYVLGVPYDESLLLWHIATEFLYNDSTSKGRVMKREFSKALSDYMLYLLIMQPSMVATVSGIGKIRFEDTCAQVRMFMKRSRRHEKLLARLLETTLSPSMTKREEVSHGCKKILDMCGDHSSNLWKHKSTTVLNSAIELARELQKIVNQREMWNIIAKMWVELLSYAAINCEKSAHTQQLSNGGELITYVWLMMAHYGLSMQFQYKAGALLRA